MLNEKSFVLVLGIFLLHPNLSCMTAEPAAVTEPAAVDGDAGSDSDSDFDLNELLSRMSAIAATSCSYLPTGDGAASDDDAIRTNVKIGEFRATIESDREHHYSVCSCQGRRPGFATEDAHCAAPVIADAPIAAYFGVFDGHGGCQVSILLKEILLSNLLLKCETMPVAQALTEAFLETNRGILDNPTFNRQGSTAIVACVAGTVLIIANAGDSRAILCADRDGTPAMEPLSTDHRPSNDDERARIEATELPGGGMGTIIYRTGVARVMGGLGVARAFGNNGYIPTILITPNPDIRTVDLSQTPGDLLVIACDGVWDVLSNDDACIIAMSNRDDLDAASRALVEAALNRGSTDNITAMVIDIRRYRS